MDIRVPRQSLLVGIFTLYYNIFPKICSFSLKIWEKRKFQNPFLVILRLKSPAIFFSAVSLREDTHKKSFFLVVGPLRFYPPYTSGLVVHATFYNYWAKTAGF